MLALMLRRHAPVMLSVAAVALFIVLGAGATLLAPRSGDARAIGDPSAPRPVTAAALAPIGRPPIARPVNLPPEAVGSRGRGGSGASQNLIEARMPDERFHSAALDAVRCAVGHEIARDPALDKVAIAIWRADALGGLDAILGRLYQEDGISVFTTIPALTNQGGDPSDQCRFGGMDLREILPRDAWGDVRVAGVAFFSESDGTPDFPLSSMVVVGRRAAP